MKRILAGAIILLLTGTIIPQGRLGDVTTTVVKMPVSSKTNADALKATEFLKELAIYDDVKKEIAFPINEVGPDYSWRLVHDGKVVLSFTYSQGVTGTIYNIIEGTYDDCLKQIETLKLEITNEQKTMAAAMYNRLK